MIENLGDEINFCNTECCRFFHDIEEFGVYRFALDKLLKESERSSNCFFGGNFLYKFG